MSKEKLPKHVSRNIRFHSVLQNMLKKDKIEVVCLILDCEEHLTLYKSKGIDNVFEHMLDLVQKHEFCEYVPQKTKEKLPQHVSRNKRFHSVLRIMMKKDPIDVVCLILDAEEYFTLYVTEGVGDVFEHMKELVNTHEVEVYVPPE